MFIEKLNLCCYDHKNWYFCCYDHKYGRSTWLWICWRELLHSVTLNPCSWLLVLTLQMTVWSLLIHQWPMAMTQCNLAQGCPYKQRVHWKPSFPANCKGKAEKYVTKTSLFGPRNKILKFWQNDPCTYVVKVSSHKRYKAFTYTIEILTLKLVCIPIFSSIVP